MSVHRMNAVEAQKLIRAYWRTREDAHLYEEPIVRINPDTFEITSDIVNGYPPLKEV